MQNLFLKRRFSRKFSAKYQGFYKILKVVSSYTYLLAIYDIFEVHDVFHTNRLRFGEGDLLPNQNLVVLFLKVSAKYHEEYEIEVIGDFKLRLSSLLLLVK